MNEGRGRKWLPAGILIGLFLLLTVALAVLVRGEGRSPAFDYVFPDPAGPAARLATESTAAKLRGNLRAWYGGRLAKQHCTACHLLPGPETLPSRAWPAVLKNMALRMGAAGAFPQLLDEERGLAQGLKGAGDLPALSALTAGEWLALSEYYFRTAPAQLPGLPRGPLQTPEPHFQAHILLAVERGKATDVTLVAAERRRISAGILSTGETGAAFRLLQFEVGQQRTRAGVRKRFRLLTDSPLAAPAVALLPGSGSEEKLVALLGGPPSGTVGVVTPLREAATVPVGRTLFAAPERVAHALTYRRGGQDSLVISAFGIFRGGLFLLPQRVSQGAQRKGARDPARQLLGLRGMVAAATGDFDGDGTPDLAALSAQEREGLHVLYGTHGANEKPGQRSTTADAASPTFRLSQVLARGPEYGFTGLVAFDLNGDGKDDLALTNGDNGDFADAGPKPYHGVSVLASTGQGFREVYRLPLYGACRLAAGDFDGDGRADLVVAALYSAEDTPFAHERAVILYNRTAGTTVTFLPQVLHTPEGFRPGVVHTADVDGDGDIDIVMGALPYLRDPTGNRTPRNRSEPLVMLFENRRR